MGLDTVELVMAVEDAFDIDISDADAEQIVTVRDLIDYTYAKVQRADFKICRTQRAFHRLRRAAQDVLGVERSAVKPSTKWEALIPLERRHDAWLQLKAKTEARHWPVLKRPTDTMVAMFAIAMATAAVVQASANNLVIATAAGAAAMSVFLKATSRWRVNFADKHASVGQIAELIAPELPADRRPAGRSWTRDEVRTLVRTIVIEHLNVDPSFEDDAGIIDDLGAD